MIAQLFYFLLFDYLQTYFDIMKTLRISGALIFLLLLYRSAAIEQMCSTDSQCPENSFCKTDFKLCRCSDGFIGQCNTSATVLTNDTLKIELNSTSMQLFSISPIQVNRLIDIKISICQIDTKTTMMAYFWGETGRQNDYNTNLTLVNPMKLTFDNLCSYITITNIYFYAQMNGDSQKLILGLQNSSEQSLAISISVDQNDILGMYLSRYFAIGVMMLLLFSLCSCMLVNIFRRARILNIQRMVTQSHSHEQEEYNIDYFQQYLPKKKKEEVIDTELVCPICLQHVQNNEIVRKTPCQHVFHCECLDSWCKKNANCPVCRFDLTYEYVRAIQDSLNVQVINQKKGYIKRWEEDIELQERYTGDHSTIREEML